MTYPIDIKTLSNDMLISGYAALIKSPHEDNPDLETMRDSIIAAHKQEIQSRIDSADMIAMVELGQIALKYLPGHFDLPIRKKITYSPTGQKAPRWLGFFSRKNRGMGADS